MRPEENGFTRNSHRGFRKRGTGNASVCAVRGGLSWLKYCLETSAFPQLRRKCDTEPQMMAFRYSPIGCAFMQFPAFQHSRFIAKTYFILLKNASALQKQYAVRSFCFLTKKIRLIFLLKGKRSGFLIERDMKTLDVFQYRIPATSVATIAIKIIKKKHFFYLKL